MVLRCHVWPRCSKTTTHVKICPAFTPLLSNPRSYSIWPAFHLASTILQYYPPTWIQDMGMSIQSIIQSCILLATGAAAYDSLASSKTHTDQQLSMPHTGNGCTGTLVCTLSSMTLQQQIANFLLLGQHSCHVAQHEHTTTTIARPSHTRHPPTSLAA